MRVGRQLAGRVHVNIFSFRDGAFRKDCSAFVVPLDNWGCRGRRSPYSDLEISLGNGVFGAIWRQIGRQVTDRSLSSSSSNSSRKRPIG